MLGLGTQFVRNALGGAIALVSTVAIGCSSPVWTTTKHSAAAAAAPDAVLVDFYDSKGGASAKCAGTLLSNNVVLTAAHCAQGTASARVRAPDAGGQTRHRIDAQLRLAELRWQLGRRQRQLRSAVADVAIRHAQLQGEEIQQRRPVGGLQLFVSGARG
jgi:hypothetical protein